MKIKQLHLRNIASIERADIDFEHDLDDPADGSPAGIFLIAGDTGSGKSAILDGIAMALYKKTPRTCGVQNVKLNEYVNSLGESVSVSSIEQYTRIGISPGDDCYSEVVFEGNDGETYRARLTLGLMRGNTDKKTGRRPVKYRTPLWEVKKGDGDWLKCSKNGDVIARATGLSFEQFGRMAMLAQGQFASFLTGSKTERESILEQLTDTARFSAFGTAIKNLFDRARATRDAEQKALETMIAGALSPEREAEMQAEAASIAQTAESLARQVTEATRRLADTDAARTAAADLESATNGLARARGELESDSTKALAAFVNQWDVTAGQRRMLANLNDERRRREITAEALDREAQTFTRLSADLLWRREQVASLRDSIVSQQAWIKERSGRHLLYTTAGHTVTSLRQLLALADEIQAATLRAEQLDDTTKKLGKDAEKASAEADVARAKADEAAKHAASLLDKLRLLNIPATNRSMAAINSRRELLSCLRGSVRLLDILGDDSARAEKEVFTQSSLLKCLDARNTEADDAYAKARAAAEEARGLLSTMEMSVDDTLVALRHNLAETHADTCPLCGSRIALIADDEAFYNLLKPLRDRRRQADERLAAAEAARNEMMEKRASASASLASVRNRLDEIAAKLMATRAQVEKEAAEASLNPNKPLYPQIEAADKELQSELERLTAIQAEGARLQQEINSFADTKRTIDNDARKAEAAKADATGRLEANIRDAANQHRLVADTVAKAERIRLELRPALSAYSENWESSECAEALEREAADYEKRLRQLDSDRALLEKAETLNRSLGEMSDSIAALCPQWSPSLQPQALDHTDAPQAWTRLHGRVAGGVETLRKTDAEIRRLSDALDAYLREAGQTLESLAAIEKRSAEVADARATLAELNARVKSRTDAMADARRRLAEARTRLSLYADASLPERAELQLALDKLMQQRDETATRLGAIRQALADNRNRALEADVQRKRLAEATTRFNRWDAINAVFGGSRFRTLVQTYILRPLLNNANIYLRRITDRYTLTCSDDNEQLSILVLDSYNKNQVRSATVLSGGERFMVSLALSLALSSLNRPDMNVNILFIDEGFGTLDEKSLDSVMSTLEKLREIAGQSNRRVGIISHREELMERIPVRINVERRSEGRSRVTVTSR